MRYTLNGLFDTNKNIFSHKIEFENIDMHNHNFIEFFYITEGTAIHVLNNKKSHLKPGNAFLLLPSDYHTFKKTNDSFVHRDIIIKTNFFINICQQYYPDLYRQLTKKEVPTSFQVSNDFITKIEACTSLLTLPSTNDVYKATEMYITTQIINLIIEKTSNIKKKIPEWINKLINELNDQTNFATNITLLIEKIGYTKEHIRRTFKKYTGLTLTDYFNEIKLNYAYTLLLRTDYSIEEIMYKIGINNVSYFYSLFKQKYNKTPREIRNDIINVH